MWRGYAASIEALDDAAQHNFAGDVAYYVKDGIADGAKSATSCSNH